MSLPSNVGHGTVTGRFIDSAGANISGTITFRPTPRRLLNATALPSAVTILPKPVTVALTEGSFTQALIATDDPDNNPHGWTYSVEFNFVDAKADGFAIEVPEGQTVDLTTVAPVGSGNGTIILRGPGVPDWSTQADGKVLVLVNGEPAWADGGGGGVSSWNDLTDKPATFPPAGHTHTVANVTGLQAALDAKADAAATTSALAGKAATSHTHTIGNVTGLQAAIDAAAASGAANVSYYVSGAWQPRGASPHPWTYDAGLTDPVPVPTDWQPGDHIISLNPPTP